MSEYDYGDMCRDMRERKQKRRAKASTVNASKFEALGIKYEAKNHGSQLLIRVKNGKPISYYPASDQWNQPDANGKVRRGWGLDSLMSRITFCGGSHE